VFWNGTAAVHIYRCSGKPLFDGVFAATDLGPQGEYLFSLLWSKITGNGRVVVPLPRGGSGQAFVDGLKDKIEAGRYVPVIDRRYSLDAIGDACRYVQTGEKAGVVVVDIVPGARPAETN
jgi:NADPH:quinone reductase-like Zn-dependent oxidoreductase